MVPEALNSAADPPPQFQSPTPCRRHEESLWNKGKRSKRHREPINEDDYLALCLIMLAQGGGASNSPTSAAAPHQRNKNSPNRTRLPSPPLPAESVENSVYKCSICNNVFRSYQALGGHKTSHRKSGGGGSTAAAAISCSASGAAGGKTHECSICHKCFPTGQALGGHMRHHYEGRGNRVASYDGAAISHRDFDLNLPVVLECMESPHATKKPRLLLLTELELF